MVVLLSRICRRNWFVDFQGPIPEILRRVPLGKDIVPTCHFQATTWRRLFHYSIVVLPYSNRFSQQHRLGDLDWLPTVL